MCRQAVLTHPEILDRACVYSDVPGFLAELIKPVREFHPIHTGGAMVQTISGKNTCMTRQAHESEPRSRLLSAIVISFIQASFQIGTNVGLLYYRGYS